MQKKKQEKQIKSNLHKRNKHNERYDFKKLKETSKNLAKFVKLNDYGDESIDFFNNEAVKALNKALLKYFYKIDNWDIPANYLCPPIPGRADYIHYAADLLTDKNGGKIPIGKNIKCLDTGVGANCVYPIIGSSEYRWSFVGSDIDKISIKNANRIIESNLLLKEQIELRYQVNSKSIFRGIIRNNEFFDLTVCNPPFHASAVEAQKGTSRKLNHLKHKKQGKIDLNFGGKSNELWCDGGEIIFLQNMIWESKEFAKSCFWFSSLVSKQSNLKNIYKTLEKAKVFETKTVEMKQGNKVSRIVAWTFLNASEQKKWINLKWKKSILL